MPKKNKKNTKKSSKSFSILKIFDKFSKFIFGTLEKIGNTVIFLVKTVFSSLCFVLELIGEATIDFFVLVVSLPSLPFVVLWEGWLIFRNPTVRQDRITRMLRSWKIVKKDWTLLKKRANRLVKTFIFVLKALRHPQPAFKFCFVRVQAAAPLLILLTFTSFIGMGIYSLVSRDLPSLYGLKKGSALSTKIYARDCSTLLYTIYRDENRTLVPLDQIPLTLRQATLAIEDKNFYHHHGFSVNGIIRAFNNNLAHRQLQGGSTITQQLVKNTLLSSERTYRRKAKELFLALETELLYSKDQILQMYLNEVAYGGTAYGVEQASKMYFGKSVRNIDLAQAAFLAGLPTAPSNYSPYTVGIAKSKERQEQVLGQMIKAGYITYQEANQAYAEPLKILPPTNQMKAPHFVMYVKDELIKKYGAKTVEEGGLNVCTTLDSSIQAMAESVVKDEVASIKRPFNVNNGATLVTKPATGEILAMVGSVDYWDTLHDGNVNITTSTRQPGSSIKLVNYAYALSSGTYTPTSIIQDTPVAYTNAWETYAPVNYDGKFRGPVTLRQALAMSLNIPAVKVLASYGVDKMIDLGKKMGITSWNDSKHYGLSLTLGAAEVKMTDMAVVYGTVANGGKRVTLNPFYRITDAGGNVLESLDKSQARSLLAQPAQASSQEPEGEQVLSPTVAYQLVDILSDNEARTPEFGPRSSLYIPGKKVAAKTGTSNDFRDNWTFGFTPNMLVASWVGNNDNKPMSGLASGITGAAPIWNKVMTSLIDNLGTEEFATPSGLVAAKICATNGLLTCPRCPKEKVEYFQPGTEPKKHCFISTPSECQARKDALQAAGKSADEIVKAMEGCPLANPSSPPQPQN